MHRVDAVENSPGVRQELAEGIGSLPGWRKGVCQKKIETSRKIIGGSLTMIGAIKLQPDNGLRSSLGIGQGLDDVVGPRREFARRFAEVIGKLDGRSPKKDQMTCQKNARGCWIGESWVLV
ncbi:hypothetical protein BHM03_00040102 [Ensete ventricosum]|nr:hypothetical protein BHM03_00040102 [Ensete ventricosum]